MQSAYDDLIKSAVAKYLPTFDWRSVKAQIQQESSFNPKAVSRAGAGGLMQIMEPTFAEWGKHAGYKLEQRFEPEANINTGCMYLAYLYNQWTSPRPEMDRLCLAFASYNAGLGNVLNAQTIANGASLYRDIISRLHEVTGEKSIETTIYVRNILTYWNKQVTG